MNESTIIMQSCLSLIIVDDDIQVLTSLKRVLKLLDIRIESFISPKEALSHLRSQKVAPLAILSDQRMPDMEGVDFLTKCHSIFPNVHKIIMSSHQDFKKISNGLNAGIINKFICKPWDNKTLRSLIQELIDKQNYLEPIKSDSYIAGKKTLFHNILTCDNEMLNLFHTIQQASKTVAPIFITGETGTGKELVAKACHAEKNNQSPFVAVNCANFTNDLIESQLFGHKKGAFTGALSDQEGVFAASKNGTLFLDEVTTLPLALQSKLLRVLQEREYCPLGSMKSKSFNAQLITASSTSIAEAVTLGIFREDLYYRLSVINLYLPPLRKRIKDVELLALYFIEKFSKKFNKNFKNLSLHAKQILTKYDWPGNIRQLENVLQSIIILNNENLISSEMLINALANTVESKANIFTPEIDLINSGVEEKLSNSEFSIEPLWLIEKKYIEKTIQLCDGNINIAASKLGVNPSTIYRKLQTWQS